MTASTIAGNAATRPRETWVIEPRGPGVIARGRELWTYRWLLPYFASQALQRLYRQTLLGVFWLVLRTLVPIASGVWIFGFVLGLPAEGVPYLLFYLAGISTWNLFQTSTVWAARSLERNRRIIARRYFPRILLLLGSLAPALAELLITAVVAASAILYYRIVDGRLFLPTPAGWLLWPFMIVLTGAFSISVGLWLSVLVARVRDVRLSLRYLFGAWFVLTPVLYPLSAVPERWRSWVELNPVTALVQGSRYALLGRGDWDGAGVVRSAVLIAVLMAGGLWFFYRSEAEMPDRL